MWNLSNLSTWWGGGELSVWYINESSDMYDFLPCKVVICVLYAIKDSHEIDIKRLLFVW